MMRTRAFVAATIIVFLLGRGAIAQTPASQPAPDATIASIRALMNEGVQHYDAGKFDEALKAFQQAADAAGDAAPPELLHDLAATQYQLGDLDAARELWVRAAKQGDPAFEARTHYNLGNANYRSALEAAQSQDPKAGQQAVEALRRAQEQYRDALRLDPKLSDARANLELAARLQQQIERMQQKQPSSQPSDSNKQKNDQQQQQQQQGDQQQQQNNKDQQQNQQQDQQQPQDESGQSDQQQQQKKSDEQNEQDEQQGEGQQNKDDQKNGRQKQQQQQDSAGQQEKQQDEPADPNSLSKQEVAKLLQMIRDAEQQRREVLKKRQEAAAAAENRENPVKKDW